MGKLTTPQVQAMPRMAAPAPNSSSLESSLAWRTLGADARVSPSDNQRTPMRRLDQYAAISTTTNGVRAVLATIQTLTQKGFGQHER